MEIIGFPSDQFDNQSPGSNSDLHEFCKLNYGVTFTIAAKSDVRGVNEHPIFSYLTKECPFKGFNTNNILEKMVYSLTAKKYPEYLVVNDIKWNLTKF